MVLVTVTMPGCQHRGMEYCSGELMRGFTAWSFVQHCRCFIFSRCFDFLQVFRIFRHFDLFRHLYFFRCLDFFRYFDFLHVFWFFHENSRNSSFLRIFLERTSEKRSPCCQNTHVTHPSQKRDLYRYKRYQTDLENMIFKACQPKHSKIIHIQGWILAIFVWN